MSQLQKSKEEKKACREKHIFKQFASTLNTTHPFQIDLDSVENNKTPMPDIRCLVSGKPHYFEMTEIVDNQVARSWTIAFKENKPTGGAFSIDSPLIKAFRQKSGKTYPALDGSLELLAFYDQQYPPPPELLKQETLQIVSLISEEMINQGSWYRIWIYDNWNKEIISVFTRQN